MPDQDKLRLDGSPLGFGRPAVPTPRSGINAASALTGRMGGAQPIESRPRTPQPTRSPEAAQLPLLQSPTLTGEVTPEAPGEPRPQVAAQTRFDPNFQPVKRGIDSLIQAATTRNPQPFPPQAAETPPRQPAGPREDARIPLLQSPTLTGQVTPELPGEPRTPQPRPAGPDAFTKNPSSGAGQAQSPDQYAGGLKDVGSAVPIGTADITPERSRDITTGAVPVAEQTATEKAAAAAGGTNAGVEGASESRPASAATLAPKIGAIPEGAIEVIRGAPFGRGQTTRAFATQDAQGNFFESTDPRSSIQQARIAGATRNPGSVESAQNEALLGLTNPRTQGIVSAQNKGQVDAQTKLGVQALRNEGIKKGEGGGAALPDLATYVYEAMSQGMSEEEATRAYYIEYAEATGGGE